MYRAYEWLAGHKLDMEDVRLSFYHQMHLRLVFCRTKFVHSPGCVLHVFRGLLAERCRSPKLSHQNHRHFCEKMGLWLMKCPSASCRPWHVIRR